MCGIGGIYSKPRATLDIESALDQMRMIQNHRGPDSNGKWICSKRAVGLSHTRLAIVDLSPTGHQPMIKDSYALVFNGEIYNWRELRAELNLRGCEFTSTSDSEVLIEAFRVWGANMLQRLEGMFAFALYDSESGIMFCARDRVGKKPFIYAPVRDGFIFASEIPAVRCVPGVDRSLDHSALVAMLLHNLRHIPDPYTAYRGIHRLRAGHALTIRDGAIERIWRYWDPKPSLGPITTENLRSILEEAVKIRMRADVPVGALLSGGVDSSAIVAMMQRHTDTPIQTYALGFDREDEDLRRARIMAGRLGTIHKEFYFDPNDQWAIFKKLLNIYGEPIMLLPLVHTYALCRAIRDDGIKVVMSGNGADELFYGYTGHIRTLRISRWLERIAVLLPILAPILPDRLAWVSAPAGTRKAAYYLALAKKEWASILTEDARMHLVNRAAEELGFWGALCPSKQFIDESNFVGLMVENTHSVTIAGDLPAMAASIETRSPFLDQQVVSFALATPVERKIASVDNPQWLKAILRESVSDLVPAELLTAPKRGFGMGIQEAMIFRGPWKNHANEAFSSPSDADGLLDTHGIQRLWERFLNGSPGASQIAKLFAMQVWLREGVNCS